MIQPDPRHLPAHVARISAADARAVGAFFVWAIRSRQFSDQDRARYLPLNSGIPRRTRSSPGACPPKKRQAGGRGTAMMFFSLYVQQNLWITITLLGGLASRSCSA